MSLTPDQVAKATGKPAANVAKVWPLVVLELAQRDIGQDLVLVCAAATIATETPAFYPLREFRANAIRQPKLYAQQEKYWGTGFYGRGLVQLTWERNYRAFQDDSGIPVVANPDLLLEPSTSAAALAWFFLENNLHIAAMRRDWRATRKLVNGGFGGWDVYISHVNNLLNLIATPQKADT